MFTFGRKEWTKEERDLLILWIKENPNRQVPYATGLPELFELFPSRTKDAIYTQWRNHRIKLGMSPTKYPIGRKTWQLPQKITTPVSDRFLKCLNDFIEAEIRSRTVLLMEERDTLKKENISFQEEVTELKSLLKKLTKVREAVEDFKL